jgi:hypothetical protein
MEEVWRPVPSFPEWEASNAGRVRLLPFEYAMPNGGVRRVMPKPIVGYVASAQKGAAHQYRSVYWNRGKRTLKVHQLVCEAFHGARPASCTDVLHLNEDGLDNRPENLRWGTRKENLNMPKIKQYHRLACSKKMGNPRPLYEPKAVTLS